ncbi:MAG TPA: glycoside hydrolase family 3 N-terminal domain-containing protein [Candidatus Sulfotelmatobacter sp.]|nr:glycoside hydrolase family 3 N-terminal domain-containing protein [Candidatus Sulfotelmatobacter sp.]
MPPTAELEGLARGTLAVGFAGANVADAPLGELRALAPGAITLFARNAGDGTELPALIAALRSLGAPPPLIAIDQEGGRVARLRTGVAPLPSAMAVGAGGDPAAARALGTLLGRDLATLGISVDLAPVADLALAPGSTVIGTRAYGDDPRAVAPFVTAFAEGLERGGVAATLKHFPGHGATALDSHAELPRVTTDAATLRVRELVPFAAAIEAGASSLVLTAHLIVGALDATLPASLAPATYRLLREELRFAGVAATDCLEMDAIAGGIGTVEGAVAALAAGADLVLISHHLELARDAVAAIVRAVESGRLPRARLEEAHARVLRLRERYAQLRPAAAEAVDTAAPLAAARRAVTSVRGAARLRSGAPVTVISFEGTLGDAAAASGARPGADAPSLSAALRRRRWKSELMRVPLVPDADDLELLLEHVPRLGEREFVLVVRRADLHPAQREAVARILALAPDALIVSAREPYDAVAWPAAQRVVCCYGDDALAFEGLADVLDGRAPASGTLPVRIGQGTAVR